MLITNLSNKTNPLNSIEKGFFSIIIHFASCSSVPSRCWSCRSQISFSSLGVTLIRWFMSIQPELQWSKTWTEQCCHNKHQLMRIIRDCQWWSLPWLFTVNRHQAHIRNRQQKFPSLLKAFLSIRLPLEISYRYKIHLMSATYASDVWGIGQ